MGKVIFAEGGTQGINCYLHSIILDCLFFVNKCLFSWRAVGNRQLPLWSFFSLYVCLIIGPVKVIVLVLHAKLGNYEQSTEPIDHCLHPL